MTEANPRNAVFAALLPLLLFARDAGSGAALGLALLLMLGLVQLLRRVPGRGTLSDPLVAALLAAGAAAASAWLMQAWLPRYGLLAAPALLLGLANAAWWRQAHSATDAQLAKLTLLLAAAAAATGLLHEAAVVLTALLPAAPGQGLARLLQQPPLLFIALGLALALWRWLTPDGQRP
jgi:hypothetical protein